MAIKFYGEAEDKAKLVNQLYGIRRAMVSLTGSILGAGLVQTFNSATFFQFLNNHRMEYRKFFYRYFLANLYVEKVNGAYSVLLQDATNTYMQPLIINGSSTYNATTLAQAGIIVYTSTAAMDDFVSILPSFGLVATAFDKFYGSVNGEARLIHQGFRHAPSPNVYGSIVYYTSSAHTSTNIEYIYEQSDVNKLVGNGQLSWSTTINNKTISSSDIKEVDISGCTSLTTTPTNFLQSCRSLDSIALPSTLTSIGTGFLSYCTSFNQKITLPSNISAIGSTFLMGCEAFNQELIIPTTVTSIGISFLTGCALFNQDLVIPSSVITIGQNFMMACNSMIKTITCDAPSPIVSEPPNFNLTGATSSSPCYVSGIKLTGAYASSWHSSNPDSSSSPVYRKTIVV